MPSDMKITNAIEKELLGATHLQRKKKENDQQYFYRVIEAVNALSDDDWEKLSEEAQDWVNEGIDAIKSNDPIRDFPAIPVTDDEEEEEEPTDLDEKIDALPDERKDSVKERAEELIEEEKEALEALEELSKTLDNDFEEEEGEEEEESEEEEEEGGDLEAELEQDIKAIKAAEKKKPKKPDARKKATGRVHKHAEATKKVAKKGNKTSEQKTGKPSGQTRIKQILAERGLDLSSEEVYFQLRTEGYEYARSTIDVIKSDFRNSCRVLSEMGLLKNMEQ